MKKLLTLSIFLLLGYAGFSQQGPKVDTTIYRSYSVYQPQVDTVPYKEPTLDQKRQKLSVNQRPQRNESGRIVERVLTDVGLVALTGLIMRH